MKTAIVHDWLMSMAGGEKVVKLIYEQFPSDIYTLIKDKRFIENSFFKNKNIKSSFIEKLPFSKKLYQKYLPFFPFAIEQLDLSKYDVILSSSHCVAKGVLTRADQMHICYCHTPMRYAWDLYHQYLDEANLNKGFKAFLAKSILHYLRMWDLSSVSRVDEFIANSKFVAQRINKIYQREAKVIYPPVDVEYFAPHFNKQNYYFTASRFVPYKKIDLIVEAFSNMPDKKLVVLGDGPDMKKIKSKAKNNIEILGYQSDEVLKELLKKAKAFVFAAIEDFGILPIEAMASATPVIALSKGGVKETVINDETGIFFENQNINSIIDAVNIFEKKDFDLLKISNHAKKFSCDRFKKEFSDFIFQKLNDRS
jgi:glycosyltransferase involved in cell wall biosynthesis